MPKHECTVNLKKDGAYGFLIAIQLHEERGLFSRIKNIKVVISNYSNVTTKSC